MCTTAQESGQIRLRYDWMRNGNISTSSFYLMDRKLLPREGKSLPSDTQPECMELQSCPHSPVMVSLSPQQLCLS